MFAELRLSRRLLTGLRGRDLARSLAVLMASTVAGATLALGMCVALLSQHEASLAAARAPLRSETATGLLVAESTATVNGRQWTDVLVSASFTSQPPPPGLRQWPQPGSSAVSPALALVLSHEPELGRARSFDASLTIGPDGLLNPAELYSYTVLTPNRALGSSFREVSGFGKHSAVGNADASLGMILAVVAILALPTAMFFNSSFGFLLSSRARRYRAFHRIGLPLHRVARMFAAECALVTGIGLSVGYVVFALVQRQLGPSGLLPVTWWPSAGELPRPLLAASVILAAAVAFRASGRKLRVQGWDRDGLRPPPRSRLVHIAGSMVIVSAAFLVGIVGYWLLTAPTLHQPATLTVAVLAAVVIGTIGLLLGMPTWSKSIALRLADLLPSASARLGIRGAAAFAMSSGRLLAALTLLCVVCGVATGFITGVGRWGVGYAATRVLEVDDLALLDPTVTTRLLTEFPYPHVVIGYESRSAAVIVAGACDGVTALDRLVRAAPGQCKEGQVQAGDQLGAHTPPLDRISLDDDSDPISVGSGEPVTDVRWSVKLPEQDRESLAHGEGATLVVPLGDTVRTAAILGYFASRFPEVPFRAGTKDADSYEIYTHYSALFLVSFGAAIAMAAAALAFVALEIAWSHARERGALVAIGLPRGRLRVAAGLQAAWGVIAALPAAGFGILAGVAVRSYFGTTDLLEPAIATAVLVPWLVAAILAGIVGASAAATRFDRGMVSDA